MPDSNRFDRSEAILLTLTRPTLTYGVPFEAFLLNLFVSFAAGVLLQGPTLWRSPFMFWLAGVPVHFALQRLTARDYHWANTIKIWAMTTAAGRDTLSCLSTRPPRAAKDYSSSV